MTRSLLHTATAELTKLRGLPAVLATVLATVGTAVALTAAFIASGEADAGAGSVTMRTMPFLHIGPILLGVLASAHEYAGSQIRTTLTAVPNRIVALIGKTTAYLVVATVTSATTLAAAFITASTGLNLAGAPPLSETSFWPMAGATVYLALIGLVAHALAVLLRSLIPPLVLMLGLVLIVSPLLTRLTEHARWLPDQAGRLLYLPHADPVLTPWTGALVLAGWIAAAALAAAIAFLTRDA